MKIVLTLFFIVLSLIVLGQEKYRVVYDYTTDRLTYYLVDKDNRVIDTLKKPKIRRNSLVELQLKNVNPFAVQVTTAVNEEMVHEGGGQSGFNFNGLLGQLGSLGSERPKPNIPTLSSQNSRGEAEESSFKEFTEVTDYVSTVRNTLLANLSNPHLSKETILQNLKQTAKSYADDRREDPSANFYAYLISLERIIQDEQMAANAEIDALTISIETPQDKPLSRGERAAQDHLLRDLDKAASSVEASSQQTIDEINEIKALYTALEAASFEQVYDYQVIADKMNIELNFVQTAFDGTATRAPAGRQLKNRKVNLQAKGGFKINTSIAMTLNNFGRSSNDYFISEEGIVGSEKNDYFVPNLSTMINFYPMISDNFNVGGSFGLSIPISDNIGGMNFLLGPSIFMGNKNRLSFSGGIAYGPISRLTNGIQVGDTTELRSLQNFTKTVYDLGYFLGVSFSLFDIK